MHYRVSPEFRLCSAMIKTALFDIFNYYESKSTGNYENFRSAIRWIYSTDISPYSFNWVCSHLEGDVTSEGIINNIKNIIQNPNKYYLLYERVKDACGERIN